MFTYKALVTKVYDGDTITVSIDLGFKINVDGYKLRLHGIDTNEMRDKDPIKRQQAYTARDRVRELILDKEITIHTIKDKTGKYGRYLAIVTLEDGTILNELLIKEGLAKVY